MENTATDNGRSPRADYRNLKDDVHDAAHRSRSAGRREFNNMIADVEDLVAGLANTLDPEISRIRAKVESGLADVRRSLNESADQVQHQAREAVVAGGRYVSNNPWQALGLAALTGLTVGFLISRR